MKTELALLTLLCSATAMAQTQPRTVGPADRFVDPSTGLSVHDAIAWAIDHEPEFRATHGSIDIARGMHKQAGLRPNPTVTFEQRDEPGGSDHQTTIGMAWPLDLFRQRGRLAVADGEVTAAELIAAERERLLAADVRSRYGDVAAAVRDLTVLDELIEVTRRQRELLGSRVEEGAAPPLDRDTAEVELRRLEADHLIQEGRLEVAMLALKRVLGMTPDMELRVRDSLETLVQAEGPPAGAVADRAAGVEERPDVREARNRIEIAEAKIDRAQRNGKFDVSLFASYMRTDSGFTQQGFGAAGNLERVHGLFHYAVAGANITMPFLNRNQGEVAAAQAERRATTAALEATRLTAQTEVASARARDAYARKAVRLYADSARPLARANLGIIDQSYDLGRISAVDVLIERRRYLDLERAYTDALRAAYDASTALKRALGDLR